MFQDRTEPCSAVVVRKWMDRWGRDRFDVLMREDCKSNIPIDDFHTTSNSYVLGYHNILKHARYILLNLSQNAHRNLTFFVPLLLWQISAPIPYMIPPHPI